MYITRLISPSRSAWWTRIKDGASEEDNYGIRDGFIFWGRFIYQSICVIGIIWDVGDFLQEEDVGFVHNLSTLVKFFQLTY